MLDEGSAKSSRAQATDEASVRAARTRWKKGVSGNPRGRPKSDFVLRDLAQQYSAEGLERLVAITRDPKTKPETVATVVGMIWDRGFGRPPASLDVKHSHTLPEEFDAFIRQLGRPAPLLSQSSG